MSSIASLRPSSALGSVDAVPVRTDAAYWWCSSIYFMEGVIGARVGCSGITGVVGVGVGTVVAAAAAAELPVGGEVGGAAVHAEGFTARCTILGSSSLPCISLAFQ